MSTIFSTITSTVIGTVQGTMSPGGGPPPPQILPIFDLPLTNSLIPTSSAGSGTPTFSRTTEAYVQDFEGLLKRCYANEARFQGTRRAANITSTATIATSNSLATTSATIGNEIRISFDAAATGTAVLSVGGSDSLSVTAGNRYAFDVFTATNTVILVTGVLMENWMFEDVTGQANQNPSNFVPMISAPGAVDASKPANVIGVEYFTTENGNTVDGSNIVTEATGAAIPAATLEGIVRENATENLFVYSDDFSQAIWQAAGAAVKGSTTVVGPTGLGNALALEETTNTNASFQLNHVTSPSQTSAVHTMSYFVKAGTTTTWAKLAGVDDTFATAEQWYNLSGAGSLGTPNGSVLASSIKAFGNGWYRCSLTLLTSALGFPFILNGTTGDGVSTYDGTAGNVALYVADAQLQLGYKCSSYVRTGAATATRTEDMLTYPEAGNVSSAAGTVRATVSSFWSLSDASNGNVAIGRGLRGYIYTTPGTASSVMETNIDNAVAVGVTQGDYQGSQQTATAYWGVNTNISMDGAEGTPRAFGTAPTGVIGIGGLSITGYSWDGTIKNVKIYAEEDAV